MKSIYFILSILLLTIYSCKDKNPQAECGCESPVVKVHETLSASYLGDNRLLVRHIVGGDMLMEELYILCSYTDTLGITSDIRTPDYIVSGIERKGCSSDFSSVPPAHHFEITQIRKIQ
jgi:hypothetical protein